jgi:hypothetical protein
VEVRFCPNCGENRREFAIYCVACGNRLTDDESISSSSFDDVFAVPPSFDSPSAPRASEPSSGLHVVTMIARIVTALSPLLAVLYFDDIWLIGSDLREIWITSVWVPALMVLIPLLGHRKFLGIAGDDARFELLAAVTALFVAIRASGALIDSAMPDDGLFVLSQLLGFAGFVVVGISFPWKKAPRSWFAENFNPVHIVIASVAALVFLVMREREIVQFLFSPASISGRSVLEYLFLAILVSVGFLRAPWRQFVALPIASLSIMSFIANVLFTEGAVRPWPNPVTFACCIALCFPWETAADEKRVSF